jgi:DNA-binding NtrC family response regulator
VTKEAKFGVLLVDDEEAVLDGLRLIVRRLGYEVHVATSARRAQQILAEKPIDVVVSDERMPGISGTAFLAALAQARPDVVRIVLSGGGLPVAQRAVNDASAFRFLRKPCSHADITKALSDAIALRRSRVPAAPGPDEASAAPAAPLALSPAASSSSLVRTPSGAILLDLDLDATGTE